MNDYIWAVDHYKNLVFHQLVKICWSTAFYILILKYCQNHTLFDFVVFVPLLSTSTHCLILSAQQKTLGFFLSCICLRYFFYFLDGNGSQEVKKLLRVVLQHNKCAPLINNDHEKPNSLVHCGRTKVFLTQPTVSSQICLCTIQTITDTVKTCDNWPAWLFSYSWICWRIRGRWSCLSVPSPSSAAGGGTSAADTIPAKGLPHWSKQVIS